MEKEVVPAIPRTDASVKRFPATLSIQRLELGEFAGISVAFLVTPVSVRIVDAVYCKPVIPWNTAGLRTLLHAFLKEIQYRIGLKLISMTVCFHKQCLFLPLKKRYQRAKVNISHLVLSIFKPIIIKHRS